MVQSLHCKAYPDEKGIETSRRPGRMSLWVPYCKAYPDEKGIETQNHHAPTHSQKKRLQSLSR